MLGVLAWRANSVPTRWQCSLKTESHTHSRTFASCWSVQVISASDAPMAVNAKMLAFTKNNGPLNNCLKSWGGSWNGASTICPLRQQLFSVSSLHLTAPRNWHQSSFGGSWWRWTWTNSISPVAAPANRSARRFFDALRRVALISPVWMRSLGVTSALRSTRQSFARELSALLIC